MDRRKFIAVGATALIAGCDGDGDDGTETPTGENPDDGTDTPEGNDGTPGSDGTPEPTATRTPRAGGDWEPDSLTWDSCTEFTVEAEQFNTVFASLDDGSVFEEEGDFSGSESFETDAVIAEVSIYNEQGRYDEENPDYEECVEEE